MAANETELVKGIKRMLEQEFSGFWFKVHGGPFQMAGIPDLVGCVRGRFYGIEVKMPGKEAKLTERQKNCIQLIVAAEGMAGMVTSIEEARAFVHAGLSTK